MKSQQAQVAALCRKYLKGRGIKCRATSQGYSMGDNVNVTIYNQPPTIKKEIEAEFAQYQYGDFNGMEDIYEYTNNRNNIPQTKYMFIENEFDKEIQQACWTFLRSRCVGADEYPEDYNEVPSTAEVFGKWASQLVYQVLNGYEGSFGTEFWATWTSEPPKPTKTKPSGEGVTIREGSRAGYSEVIFPSMPSSEIRSQLKGAGFRWSPRNSLWYGLTERLPFNAETASSIEMGEPQAIQPSGDKFKVLADKMQDAIDDKFRDRLTNTQKRMAQANGARFEGERLKRTQTVLYALARLHDKGECPVILQGLNSKKAVYDLMGEGSEHVPNGYHAYIVGNGKPKNESPLVLALWSLLTGETPEEKQAKELQRKIEGLQFSKIPGYFPTPDAVIDLMLERADIHEADKVLEPNLGSCAIADRVAPLCGTVTGFEINHTLAEICEAKGYLRNNIDFLKVDIPNPVDSRERILVDKVLMNPPFENMQDVDHVRHAFRFLKEGGRLVSIMSPSPFFREDEKAQAFRQWFDALGGEKIDLAEGSFKESGTGTNSVMVIINN